MTKSWCPKVPDVSWELLGLGSNRQDTYVFWGLLKWRVALCLSTGRVVGLETVWATTRHRFSNSGGNDTGRKRKQQGGLEAPLTDKKINGLSGNSDK